MATESLMASRREVSYSSDLFQYLLSIFLYKDFFSFKQVTLRRSTYLPLKIEVALLDFMEPTNHWVPSEVLREVRQASLKCLCSYLISVCVPRIDTRNGCEQIAIQASQKNENAFSGSIRIGREARQRQGKVLILVDSNAIRWAHSGLWLSTTGSGTVRPTVESEAR